MQQYAEAYQIIPLFGAENEIWSQDKICIFVLYFYQWKYKCIGRISN